MAEWSGGRAGARRRPPPRYPRAGVSVRAVLIALAMCVAAVLTVNTGIEATATSFDEVPKDNHRLLLGVGPQADNALRSDFVSTQHVGMLTSWYNGPADLKWMATWRGNLVPQAYADGYALHLVVYGAGEHVTIPTQFGTACGSAYPLSDSFVDDMRSLATTFAGRSTDPPLFVTLFTEFQTYPCANNGWAASPEATAYYQALKLNYVKAMDLFHTIAPNSRVSLGWGGWQSRWDDPPTGGGRSMFAHFEDVMRASDFQSFQAMQSDGNVSDIQNMVGILGRYGPVMVAHYLPDNQDGSVIESDLSGTFTDKNVADLVGAGLFAFSFMDTASFDKNAAVHSHMMNVAGSYGRARGDWLGFPAIGGPSR